MADRAPDVTAEQFQKRVDVLTRDFQKELVKQKADLEKIKKITDLHKELGIEDTGMENTLDAVIKAVDLIGEQLNKGPPKIELT